MRQCELERNTAETQIQLKLNLDGTGESKISSGVGFLDHMLTLFSRHGRFDLELKCNGDTYVDDHHSVEDIGILLGSAFRQCLGDKKGISRYGSAILPMDETLILAAVDLSGRSVLRFNLQIPTQKVGTFDTELVEEFFIGFSRTAGANLHIKQLDGTNSHHIIEGTFKAVARALRDAVRIDPELGGRLLSTKEVLE